MLIFLGGLLTVATVSTNLLLAWSLPSGNNSQVQGYDEPMIISQGSAMERNMKKNDRGMLHVVTTRFMQLQPDLVALGEARLRLFETFCLPSMINQHVDNFVWFIMTDPQLAPSLLARLQELLSPNPHFFLVMMNSKLVTPRNLTNLIDDQRIISGDIPFLKRLMLDTNRPLLLETRLDADDALSGKTLEKIQYIAMDLPIDQNGWQVICNDLHYEWRNVEIMEPNTTTVQSSGQLRLVMESICVTPGYTLVRHRSPGSIEFPEWPSVGHHLVNREWPKCLGHSNATTDCWTRLPKYPAAFRSRTVTSAGMSRVETKDEDRLYENHTAEFWKFVERDFQIKPAIAKMTSEYLKANLVEIVADNLKGQW